MEHIYPAFERGRIMKKELLLALRDYSYSALQLQYQNYSKGIISGCKIRIEDNKICIMPGIIKCQDFIFLNTEEQRIEYKPTNNYTILKFCVIKQEICPDYVKYLSEFILDEQSKCEANEVEVCRFKLREGARLRVDYKDFYDIQTEYDTVNLANATWAADEENTLSKEITDCFAKKILECESADDRDIYFAYLLLQTKDAVNYKIIRDYINKKTGQLEKENQLSTEDAFYKLKDILDETRLGMKKSNMRSGNEEHRMIIWD